MTELHKTRRNLPHWSLEGSWYYVTFCVQTGVLSWAEQEYMREHIKSGHDRFYRLIAVCVMPDHVHIILTPNDGVSLSRIMQGIKGASSRHINLLRGSSGALWQLESWDRIIRDDDELQQKLGYMLMNPVEAGLISEPWSYVGWYLQE